MARNRAARQLQRGPTCVSPFAVRPFMMASLRSLSTVWSVGRWAQRAVSGGRTLERLALADAQICPTRFRQGTLVVMRPGRSRALPNLGVRTRWSHMRTLATARICRMAHSRLSSSVSASNLAAESPAEVVAPPPPPPPPPAGRLAPGLAPNVTVVKSCPCISPRLRRKTCVRGRGVMSRGRPGGEDKREE